MPIVYIDNFAVLQKHMTVSSWAVCVHVCVAYDVCLIGHCSVVQLINEETTEMELSINYSPISIGRIRVWTQFSKATDALHQFGVLYVVCGVWDAWCVKCLGLCKYAVS